MDLNRGRGVMFLMSDYEIKNIYEVTKSFPGHQKENRKIKNPQIICEFFICLLLFNVAV